MHDGLVLRRLAIALILLAFIVLGGGPAVAAVGHGVSGTSVAKFVESATKPGAPISRPGGHGIMESIQSQAASWSGGILALEGFRKLASPITSAISAGLSKILPSGAATMVGRLTSEFISGAAFKVGMDASTGLLKTGQLKAPDWLEVGAAAAGMVLGGALLRPLGPIGEAIGSWVGWSLGENLVKNYRAGKGWNLFQAFQDIDVPRLAIQAVSAEGAGLVAQPLANALLGGIIPMGGPLGLVAGLGIQIGITALASTVANRVADSLLGKSKDEEDDSVPALEERSKKAYAHFVLTSRSKGATDAETVQALGDYRAAKHKLDMAKKEPGSPDP